MATTPSLAHESDAALDPAGPGFFAKLAYFLMFLGVVVLGVTGIGTFLLGKAPMTHWTLMAHVGASPMFTVGLTFVALTWPTRLGRQTSAARFLFWLVLLVGLLVILTGVVPMTPVFGTHGQHLLYLAHRFTAIALAPLVVLHLLSLLGRRRA